MVLGTAQVDDPLSRMHPYHVAHEVVEALVGVEVHKGDAGADLEADRHGRDAGKAFHERTHVLHAGVSRQGAGPGHQTVHVLCTCEVVYPVAQVFVMTSVAQPSTRDDEDGLSRGVEGVQTAPPHAHAGTLVYRCQDECHSSAHVSTIFPFPAAGNKNSAF